MTQDETTKYLRSEVNRLNNVIADRDWTIDGLADEVSSLINLVFWTECLASEEREKLIDLTTLWCWMDDFSDQIRLRKECYDAKNEIAVSMYFLGQKELLQRFIDLIKEYEELCEKDLT